MIHPSSSANVRSLAAQFLAVAFGLVVCATSADAAEDGGARSVFGYGAGNRALAIGGAYCGIAEDGTAPRPEGSVGERFYARAEGLGTAFAFAGGAADDADHR